MRRSKSKKKRKVKEELTNYLSEVKRRARLQGHGRHDYYASHHSYAVKESISKI